MTEIDTRTRVYNFYLTHRDKPKSFTAAHFILEGVPKSTVYDIINRAENAKGIERRPGSGRKSQIMNKKGINALSKAFEHICSISQRQAARKFKCTQQYISKTLKKKTSIRYRKKTKIPARSETQKTKIKTRINRMVRNLANLDLVLDDESYFSKSNNNNSGNSGFYTSDVFSTPSDVKYKPKQKFEEHILVYVAISNVAISN